jgi:hypothetical protein
VKKLSRLHRLRAFEIARYALAKSNGDLTKAEDIVNAEARKLGIDPILMGLLIQLAMYLLKAWWENRNKAMVGEIDDEIDLTEYTQDMDDALCAQFPDICEPGRL